VARVNERCGWNDYYLCHLSSRNLKLTRERTKWIVRLKQSAPERELVGVKVYQLALEREHGWVALLGSCLGRMWADDLGLWKERGLEIVWERSLAFQLARD
jgi:hypothetical protein